MLGVILLTEFVTPGKAAVSADDVDAPNPALEVDSTTDGSVVRAVPASVYVLVARLVACMLTAKDSCSG